MHIAAINQEAGALNTAPPSPIIAYGETSELMLAMHEILESVVFCKAQRMCRLLRFLVEMSVQGKPGELCEFAIGVAVFDRNSENYHTGEDPVVRVQVGRLRDKLKTYYEKSEGKSTFHISIPLGTYMPVISRIKNRDDDFSHQYMLALSALKCITPDADGKCFAEGMTEELSHQLFVLFGSHIVSHTLNTQHQSVMNESKKQAAASHLLEGSIRFEGLHIRLAIRLGDTKSGSIVWSECFDRHGTLSMAAQSAFSSAVCLALPQYFREG